jgi:hypothetical protein
LRIDGFDILDQTGSTLVFKTPGAANILTATGSIPSNTTVTFDGSVQVGTGVTNGVTPSANQKNSSYGSNTDTTQNDSRIATNWIYSHFIEAPNERGTSSTGVAIGSGTGFSDTGEVSIVAGNNVAAVKFQSGQVVPGTASYDFGTTTNLFGTYHGVASTAQYADLAERYTADADYEPGTVLVFGGSEEVTQCTVKGDRKVAGVVSTDPAYLMNSQLQSDHVVDLALQGRVPCKVIGKVAKGDILVTSAVPGYAIVNNDPKVGTVIGKAVGTKDDTERGVVEVVVGRV